jgi:enamine deaminase RidA (YjgF/YER057c/UK114 family)
MGDHRPARAIVPIGPLKGDYVVEIQVMAMLP